MSFGWQPCFTTVYYRSIVWQPSCTSSIQHELRPQMWPRLAAVLYCNIQQVYIVNDNDNNIYSGTSSSAVAGLQPCCTTVYYMSTAGSRVVLQYTTIDISYEISMYTTGIYNLGWQPCCTTVYYMSTAGSRVVLQYTTGIYSLVVGSRVVLQYTT